MRPLLPADLRLNRRQRQAVTVTVDCTECRDSTTLTRECHQDNPAVAVTALMRQLNQRGWRVDAATHELLCPLHARSENQAANG